MWETRETLERMCDDTPYGDAWYVNCGGHAFGVQGWYSPSDTARKYNDDAWHTGRKGQWRRFERKCVIHILRDFPELKLADRDAIENVSIDLEKYEVIAFRTRRSRLFSDFHFMRCEENGDWTEKCGHKPKIIRHPYEDIFDIWGEYDGRLYFFVRERKERSSVWQNCLC